MTDGGDKARVAGQTSSASAERDGRVEPDGSDVKDVVFLGPPTDDGNGVHVLRARDQRLEAGELRNLEDGQPITGEVVSLAPRKNNPRVCDVRESYRPPSGVSSVSGRPGAEIKAGAEAKVTKGPAQVATQAYRDNWDETFARRPRGALN